MFFKEEIFQFSRENFHPSLSREFFLVLTGIFHTWWNIHEIQEKKLAPNKFFFQGRNYQFQGKFFILFFQGRFFYFSREFFHSLWNIYKIQEKTLALNKIFIIWLLWIDMQSVRILSKAGCENTLIISMQTILDEKRLFFF